MTTTTNQTCQNCGEEIVQRANGSWDLVYVLYRPTDHCFGPDGTAEIGFGPGHEPDWRDDPRYFDEGPSDSDVLDAFAPADV